MPYKNLTQKEYARLYWVKNKEILKPINRLRQIEYEKNPEYRKKLAEKVREYYLKNKEKKLRSNKLYYKNHPEKRRVKDLKKREKKRERRLKLRFTIFKRDKYTCQYCGRKAPNVILEVDHIYPKSKGGLDEVRNYKTACKECNIGKGDSILDEFN